MVDLRGFYNKHSSVFWIDVTIEQNTAFVASAKNCISGYLTHRNRESTMYILSQVLDIELSIPASDKVFKLQALLLGF